PKKVVGGVPEGRCVTCVRWPVWRSSTTIWAACSPPGPGPRSVKAIRRPVGLKDIGGGKAKLAPPKLRSRLAGPRRRRPVPFERTKKNPFFSGGSRVKGERGKIENSSFTSNTTPDPSRLTPRRCSAPYATEELPHR